MTFRIQWDATIISRPEMLAVILDAGKEQRQPWRGQSLYLLLPGEKVRLIK